MVRRTDVSARIALLAAKRRGKTITPAELRELDRLEERTRTLTEWVAEPTDVDGDIIDPLTFNSESEARGAAPGLFADFMDAAYVDIARLKLTGNALDGVTDREYDYRVRYYRDGRVATLTTSDNGLEPVEVSNPPGVAKRHS